MSYYEDEEKKETLQATGIVCAFVVWMGLTFVLTSLMDIFNLRYLPPYQRNVILKNEKVMLENEIKYRFATNTGIKIKMEEK